MLRYLIIMLLLLIKYKSIGKLSYFIGNLFIKDAYM